MQLVVVVFAAACCPNTPEAQQPTYAQPGQPPPGQPPPYPAPATATAPYGAQPAPGQPETATATAPAQPTPPGGAATPAPPAGAATAPATTKPGQTPAGAAAAAPKPAGNPDGKADGEPCSGGKECKSGVCEGEGCGFNAGRCMPATRTCSPDQVPFCGCNGQTFAASSHCPGRLYKAKGECK